MKPEFNEKALARRVKDHVLGRSHEFFAVVAPGFEETARRELLELGIAAAAAGRGGLAFSGRLEQAWRANLGAGTLSRVLMRLERFKATGFAEFRERLAAIPWELHLADGARALFAVSAARSRLWHEGRLEEEAARAVSSRLAAAGLRVDCGAGQEGDPGQLILIRLEANRCQVSLDTSGELLHRRGLGKFTGAAPLRETLAHAVLREAGIGHCRILIDPFCGSGTFALEAGSLLLGLAPGRDRCFAFQAWPSFRPARYRYVAEELAKELRARAKAGPRRIYCSDIDAKAVDTARRNVAAAGLGALAEVDQSDFFRLHPPAGDRSKVLLAMNPPYGARQSAGGDALAFYRRIGDKVRRDYAGCAYAIIVPGLENEKALGLPHDRKILFHNGGIGVALLIKDSVTSDK